MNSRTLSFGIRNPGASRLLSSSNSLKGTPNISWNDFFALRKKIQTLQRISGVPFMFGFLTAEASILSLPIFDPTRPLFGMDPLVVVGLSSIMGSFGAYLAGVSLSGLLWKRLRPGLAAQLNSKQSDFYRRITKYRANVPPNPTQMNFSFDFYGEKIKSVSDYRSWLRHQHKLKKDRVFQVRE